MKIYTENQVSNYAQSVGEPGIGVEAKRVAAYGEELNQSAEAYEKQAKQTYSTALKVEATDTMNSLYEQYKNDPVALKDAFKKTYDKVLGEIADDDVKVNFMADVQLKSQAYLTKAAENKRKSDYRIAKSLTYDAIDKDIETAGLAFSSILGNSFNADNVAAYGKSVYDADRMINLTNEDGTNMFSDEQRKEKRKALDRVHLVALKSNFNDMPAYQMKKYAALLADDNVNVPIGVGEDKQIVMSNLQNVVSQETYEKFKEYVDRVSKRKNSIKSKGAVLDDDEAFDIAKTQIANSIKIKNEMKSINEKDLSGKYLKKEEPTEYIVRSLELLDNIQILGDTDGISDSDYKKFSEDVLLDVMRAVTDDKKITADTFDDAVFKESVMSVGLQAMKTDGKLGGKAWSDSMSIVMLRDFYSMAKESNLDLRATDSGSREAAKKLASKAIENTIEMAVGGYGKEFNSVFLNGKKVSKNKIIDNQEYSNPNYIIENGKKKYNETGIEVDL